MLVSNFSTQCLHFNGHFPGGLGLGSRAILDFTGANDDGGGSDNWNHKTCKAPGNSSMCRCDLFRLRECIRQGSSSQITGENRQTWNLRESMVMY